MRNPWRCYGIFAYTFGKWCYRRMRCGSSNNYTIGWLCARRIVNQKCLTEIQSHKSIDNSIFRINLYHLYWEPVHRNMENWASFRLERERNRNCPYAIHQSIWRPNNIVGRLIVVHVSFKWCGYRTAAINQSNRFYIQFTWLTTRCLHN